MASRASLRSVDVRGNIARTATWWRARSTRARLRILVAVLAVVGVVRLVFAHALDVLLLLAAALILLMAESLPAPKPAARPH